MAIPCQGAIETLRTTIAKPLHHRERDGVVRVSAHAIAASVIIQVVDTGSGMEADQLSRIFDALLSG